MTLPRPFHDPSLQVLESLACGTPVVLPHCGVFDELWMTRIPNEWIYDEGTKGSLLASLRHAGARTSKAYLVKNPVRRHAPSCTMVPRGGIFPLAPPSPSPPLVCGR